MHYSYLFRKSIVLMVVMAMINLSIATGPVYASMIQTSDVIQQESKSLQKKQLIEILEREKVQDQLNSWGVDPATARSRINALTDQEIMKISEHIQDVPAGGSAVGAIVGAGLVVFFVLLITDILGVTDVYSFVNR